MSDGKIHWGKVLMGVASIAGIAVAAVALGGGNLANVITNPTVSGAISTVTKEVVEYGGKAASAIGLQHLVGSSPETQTAVLGGAVATAGVVGKFLLGSGKPKDDSTQAQLDQVKSEVQDIKAAIMAAISDPGTGSNQQASNTTPTNPTKGRNGPGGSGIA